MGNGYKHQNHHQIHQYHRNITFLPMLCSRTSSVKDVHLPGNWKRRTGDDPSSPTVGCMGQVKRNHHKNRVIAFPNPYRFTSTTTSSTTSSATNTPTTTTTINIKYHKLKRLFSGKNLSFNAAATTAVNKNRGDFVFEKKATVRPKLMNADAVNVAELDPPLPVVKKTVSAVAEDGRKEEQNNLWKRRSAGVTPLKGLELKPIHLPNTTSSISLKLQTTTV